MNLYKNYLSKIKKVLNKNKKYINFKSEKELSQIILETPPDKFNFDLSSNAAMILAKSNKENPRSIAEKIKEILLKEVNDFSEINVAGPGFLNFKLTLNAWIKIVEEILKTKKNMVRIIKIKKLI